MTHKLIAPLVAALAGAALAASAGALLPHIELKPGQRIVLTNGKSVVAKGAGASTVFGIVGIDGIIRWFPQGAKLMRDVKGTVFLEIHGQKQALGIFNAIQRPPAVQHSKVMQPASATGGKGPEATHPPRSHAPPSASLTPLALKAGHKLTLTNHRAIIAKGAGASTVFGIVGIDGIIRWFPAGAKLMRDAHADIFIEQGRSRQLVGRSAAPGPVRERVNLRYAPVKTTHQAKGTSATEEWPTSEAGAAGAPASGMRQPATSSLGNEILKLEGQWPAFSANMRRLEQRLAKNPRSTAIIRQMSWELASATRTIQ
ncbi:MAG TPA: hypothetical protein VKA53_00480, partial [Thermoanaerobaculia bacterium]|nr:hypothetical protein [Thermoanaerobaculia bacterium]